ncbi:MAG: MBL fold metallo-hydrolase [Deltaproteobacteria bacterium]|nr:MAG: MBL fold metallo-hydrolase [Deltaproteobacteria bacterium]
MMEGETQAYDYGGGGFCMKVKFWGVRGSLPAPILPNEIENKIVQAVLGARGVDLDDNEAVSNYVSTLPYFQRTTTGGNTSCVQVSGENTEIILDAGSGIRQLGIELMQGPCGQGQGCIHLLISHTHWDHIMGFPFFTPAYAPGNQIIVYGRHPRIKERFQDQHQPDHFPVSLETMSADVKFVELDDKRKISIGEFVVSSIALRHPGGSFSYRIEKNGSAFVYATDAEYKGLSPEAMERYISFYADSEALVFDAQFTLEDAMEKEGWGHSSSMVGVDIALKANIKKLILFHHEPSYNDEKLQEIYDKTIRYYEMIKAGRNLEIIMAREGLEMEI